MARQHTSGQRVTWSGSVFANPSAFTFACWFKVASGEGGWLFSGEEVTSASSAYMAIFVDPTNTYVRAQADHQGGLISAGLAQSANGVATAGVWHHACARFDQAARNICVDGTQRASDTANESVLFPGFRIVEVCHLNTNNTNATGRVAEAAIWTVLLSDDEVGALARGVPAHRVRPGALALYWPLWGIGSTEIDLSANGRNGTVTGATAADHAPVGR